MGEYLRPTSVEAALRALGTANLTIIAGGTDIYPARVGRTFADDVLDLSAITGLGGIEEGPDGWRIGARATWSERRRRTRAGSSAGADLSGSSAVMTHESRALCAGGRQARAAPSMPPM